MSENNASLAVAQPSIPALRHDWRRSEVAELFAMPFNDLLFKAQSIHRVNFDPNEIQVSTLLSIKTGACPEDCKYCHRALVMTLGLKSNN